MNVDYLPINKESIFYRPEEFTMDLENNTFLFRISYNVYDKSFYFSMYYDLDVKPIIEGKKIVYGMDLLKNAVFQEKLDNVRIVIVDFSGSSHYEGVTKDNFMKSVKPYIIVEGG
ncbi:MAG: hypothetical protein K9L62_15895 [Vallitaleaceae bacterium]|nr:hypothetical protein [Vallitaleaceae bacterium]